MVIQVQPDTETAVRERVERGEYEDADAVIRTALHLLDLHQLRGLIDESSAQFARGEYVILTPEVMDEIEREADVLARSGAPLRPHVLP